MKNRLLTTIVAIFASAAALSAAEATVAAAPAAAPATAANAAAPAAQAQAEAPKKEINTLLDKEVLAKPFENLSASASVAYESEDIFRGKLLAYHTVMPSVDLGYAITDGLSAYANYAGAYGADNSYGENDFGAGVAYSIDNFTFDLGYIAYTYTNEAKNEHEIAFQVSYDTADFLGDFNVSPFAAFYYNFTYCGTVLEGGLSYSAPVTKWLLDENWGSLDSAVYVGWLDCVDGDHNGYVYAGASVNAVVQITDNMSVSAGVRWACNNDGGADNHEQSVWFGSAVSFGF